MGTPATSPAWQAPCCWPSAPCCCRCGPRKPKWSTSSGRARGASIGSFTVAPGKFAELCGSLSPGQTVNWSFDADGPLNFNIHHHVGKDVQYPKRLNQTYRSRGKLAVKSSQDYCWMWTNKSATAAQLAVRLELK